MEKLNGRPGRDQGPESLIAAVIPVEGMTCSGCESRIEKALLAMDGVEKARASRSMGRVRVGFDPGRVSLASMEEAIRRAGYTVPASPAAGKSASPIRHLWLLTVLPLLYMLLQKTGLAYFIPDIDRSMSLGFLFVAGLLTSFHCVAMCGGLALSQTLQTGARPGAKEPWSRRIRPALLYNVGRVLSYTVVGGVVGGIGSAVSFTGSLSGVVAILSGAFMMWMGLSMLGLLPAVRLSLFRPPRGGSGKNRGPFYVGLLNGLMPCGPLQAMQLYALGTGSPLVGALSMLLFGLGTVPLMFSFGAVSSLLSRRFTRGMAVAGASLVLVLGFSMLNRGLSLSGFTLGGTAAGTAGAAAVQKDGVQEVRTSLQPGRYTPLTVQKGVPVRWIITADEKSLNGCNNPIVFPGFGLKVELKPGENVVEFTPGESGVYPYSCWMGMIRSTVSVTDGPPGSE